MRPLHDRDKRRVWAGRILGWARDVLRENALCGLGMDLRDHYVVIWPALIDAWIHQPETHGRYLGTLSRASTVVDVEALLPPEEDSAC